MECFHVDVGFKLAPRIGLLLWILWAMGPSGVFSSGGNGTADGDTVVNVGALFTFDSVIGKAVKPGLLAAIDDVNSDPNTLKGKKLNLLLHDTNCSGFLGTIEGKYCVLTTTFRGF